MTNFDRFLLKKLKKIILNFITDLLSNRRRNDVYNLTFIIINKYIKVIKYFIINFAKFFINKIIT